MTNHSSSTSDQTRHIALLWWAGLLVIVGLALWLRFTGADFGLPYREHFDEADLYGWGIRVRDNFNLRSIGGSHSQGYPPLFVWTLALEQTIVDALTGASYHSTIYMQVARSVNIIFGGLTVLLGGLVGRKLHAPVTGLLAAVALAFLPLHASQSRIANANSLWTFLAFLSFWLVLYARKPLKFGWLHIAVVAALLSMLSKYMTAPLVALPLAAMWLHGRENKRLTVRHMLVAVGLIVAILLWLYFIYDVLSFLDKPTDPIAYDTTFSSVPRLLVRNAIDVFRWLDGTFFFVTLAAGLLAEVALQRVEPARETALDWEGVAYAGFFFVCYYALMSLFRSAPAPKWLVFVSLMTVLWVVACANLASLLVWLVQRVKPLPQSVKPALAGALTLALVAPILAGHAQESVSEAREFQLQWTPGVVSDWFYANVPQGARVVAERKNPFPPYTGPGTPSLHHADVVDSLFERSLAEYQAGGVEYLVADSDNATKGGFYGKPEAPEFAALERALEVSNEGQRGPKLIVFAVPPLMEHTRYLRLDDVASLRGYDLPRSELQPGFVLEFTLYWMSISQTPDDYVVQATLVDTVNDEVVAQHENQPDNGFKPTSTWAGDMQFIPDQHRFVLPDDLAAGEYELRIVLVGSASGAALDVTKPNGDELGESFILDTITITH